MDTELLKLAEQLAQTLKRAGLSLATAESCTGGGLAQVLTAIPGSSLVLIAEAAHAVPPIGAQGLNMSLADLSCLLDLL